MISILLALKDNPTLTVLSYHLERHGFIVNSSYNTEDLFIAIERIEPSILIVDEDIPGEVGVNVLCANLKAKYQTKNIHIILVSKNSQEGNTNISDYILKPFVPSEMVSKVKALANEKISYTNNKILSYNGIEMQVGSFKVSRLGKAIHLGPTEFKILQCFLELPGKVLSREHIMNHVWGYGSQVEPRTIDVHINRLRSALKEDEDETSLIRTIRSAGYSLNVVRSTVKV
ncbi:MAG: winged helix-turn-helix domain-containing protein [Rickettsiales bacterium]|jgi:two-component system phosphate regulon response regulator PhoB|nr:winged helix-turn-helix domain-containing protein [Rickettsiales bacterium]